MEISEFFFHTFQFYCSSEEKKIYRILQKCIDFCLNLSVLFESVIDYQKTPIFNDFLNTFQSDNRWSRAEHSCRTIFRPNFDNINWIDCLFNMENPSKM